MEHGWNGGGDPWAMLQFTVNTAQASIVPCDCIQTGPDRLAREQTRIRQVTAISHCFVFICEKAEEDEGRSRGK
ncbi:hypothetical protein ZHAS_00007179 [Anopheles sinensis]|uniref:Uncharacterized protein n=1 Tax=Anopheles sinensis TaxID=74873 RepID=A0A084VPB7_ANOSI|nr:hypothetical protein ZHAS_00007179 [Anopheles sinensis]